MTSIGYVFILVALLLIRALTKGRSITQVPGDFTDALSALVQGNQTQLGEVLKRTGDTQTSVSAADVGTPSDTSQTLTSATNGGGALVAEMKRLGKSATYRLGSTGPTQYDCSSLVWKAMVNLGFYKGPRFTTFTFPVQLRSYVKKLAPVELPQVGDIVWWQNHMGVIDGPGTFYAAQSSRSGIRSLPIKAIGGSPWYYRLNTTFFVTKQ